MKFTSQTETDVDEKVVLSKHIDYVETLVAQGGPMPEDHESFTGWISDVARDIRLGRLTEEDVDILRESFGSALSPGTLQGFSLEKPHGYPGDFEIIDKIYLKHITDNAALRNWDRYYQSRSAAIAVRNRKSYFHQLLRALVAEHGPTSWLPILNVASGPARDLREFFQRSTNGANIQIECVDVDREAIKYAKGLCRDYLRYIDFHEMNALRFQSDHDFQLIWSAGLFDYLGDKGFKFLLGNLLSMLREDGELVIGNFNRGNPTREYMEVVADWHLYYRTKQELINLAMECGVKREDIRVGKEPEGINLFLHIKHGSDFLDLEPGK